MRREAERHVNSSRIAKEVPGQAGIRVAMERMAREAKKQKNWWSYTYNSWDSLVVTHPTTNQPACGLSTAERTGSPVFHTLWSYVLDITKQWFTSTRGLYRSRAIRQEPWGKSIIHLCTYIKTLYYSPTSDLIILVARSATAYVVAIKLLHGMAGKMLASTIRKFDVPYTLSLSSTTPSWSRWSIAAGRHRNEMS